MPTLMIEAYPLCWPVQWPRTAKEKRRPANFHSLKNEKSSYGNYTYKVRKQLSVAEATKRLLSELDKYTKPGHPYRVHKESIIVSTNIPIRKDGLPYSNFRNPDDPGVAVYFNLDARPYCLPCDAWDRVEDNIAAIAAHISAMRGIERWGVGSAHNVYTDFKALPEQSSFNDHVDVWQVLGLSAKPASIDIVHQAYKVMAKKYHPDKGGNIEKFHQLQQAYKQAISYY